MAEKIPLVEGLRRVGKALRKKLDEQTEQHARNLVALRKAELDAEDVCGVCGDARPCKCLSKADAAGQNFAQIKKPKVGPVKKGELNKARTKQTMSGMGGGVGAADMPAPPPPVPPPPPAPGGGGQPHPQFSAGGSSVGMKMAEMAPAPGGKGVKRSKVEMKEKVAKEDAGDAGAAPMALGEPDLGAESLGQSELHEESDCKTPNCPVHRPVKKADLYDPAHQNDREKAVRLERGPGSVTFSDKKSKEVSAEGSGGQIKRNSSVLGLRKAAMGASVPKAPKAPGAHGSPSLPAMKAELEKVAPPGWGEEAMHKLKAKVGEERAFKIAWASHNKGNKDPDAKKAEKVWDPERKKYIKDGGWVTPGGGDPNRKITPRRPNMSHLGVCEGACGTPGCHKQVGHAEKSEIRKTSPWDVVSSAPPPAPGSAPRTSGKLPGAGLPRHAGGIISSAPPPKGHVQMLRERGMKNMLNPRVGASVLPKPPAPVAPGGAAPSQQAAFPGGKKAASAPPSPNKG